MRPTLLICSLTLVAACSEPPPPLTVSDFMADKILLEATMVRCAQNRSKKKYESECVSAREAANRIASMEAKDRRAEFERQSERKRQALRRTQQAASEARRRAADAQRRREDAAYLSQFESALGDGGDTDGQQLPPDAESLPGNEPGVQVGPPIEEPEEETGSAEPVEQAEAKAGDLDSIREELKRRQDKPR